MSALRDFYMAALDAEFSNAPDTEFSARIASFYCRMIMAIEAAE